MTSDAPSSLEFALLREVESVLQARGRALSRRDTTLQRIRAALYSEDLAPEEAELVAPGDDGRPAVMEGVGFELLSRRIRRAVLAGLVCEDVSNDVTLGPDEGASLQWRRELELAWQRASGEADPERTEGSEKQPPSVRDVPTDLDGLAEHLARVVPNASVVREVREVREGAVLDGKYLIKKQLGRGGYGSVFEAEDQRIRARVAIKLLDVRRARSRMDQKAFQDEARRVTQLDHQNIVGWKAFDETEDGLLYFVMEYVQGEDLGRLLRNEGRLEPMRAARILLQMLDALRAAHHLSESESILHLDLKPSNVFVVPGKHGVADERVKVIDFGIGQYIGGAEYDLTHGAPLDPAPAPERPPDDEVTISVRPSTRPATDRTQRCQGCTPEYASPEQCAHFLPDRPIAPLDGRSDLYSLGVIAFRMLSGELPYPSGLDRREYLRLHIEAPPRRLADLAVRVPRELQRFVERCLEKDRERRWRDANEAYEFLRRFVHPRERRWAIAAGVAVAGAAAALAWAIVREPLNASTPIELRRVNERSLDRPEYFGPERREVRCKFPVGLDSNASLRLQDLDGEPCTSWTVSSDGGDLVIRAAAQAESVAPTRLVLARSLESGSFTPLSAPFEVAFLGADALELGVLTWSDEASTQVIQGQRVYRNGMQLRVPVKGFADLSTEPSADPRRLIRHVTFEADDGRQVELQAPVQDGSLLTYSLSLDRLDCDGRCSGRIVVEDVAENKDASELEFTVAGEVPKIVRNDFRPKRERNVFFSDESPHFDVELDRNASVGFEVEFDGGPPSPREGEELAPGRFVLNLSPYFLESVGQRRLGRVRAVVEDSGVIYERRSDARLCGNWFDFELRIDQPELAARIDCGGSIPLSGVPTEAPNAYRSPETMARLVVERLSGNDRPVRARFVQLLGDETIAETSIDGFDSFGFAADFKRELSFSREGLHRLRVDVWPLEAPESAPPLRSLEAAVLVSGSAPTLELTPVAWPRCATAETQWPLELDLRYRSKAVTATNLGLPCERIRATVRRKPGDPRAVEVALPAADGTLRVRLPKPWDDDRGADGKYEWTFEAIDAAGHRSETALASLDVDLDRPKIRFVTPSESAEWWPLADGFEVIVEVSSEFDIGAVECTVVDLNSSDHERKFALESGNIDGRYSKAERFGPDWSEARVRIDVAVTGACLPGFDSLEPVTLSKIAPPPDPPKIDVANRATSCSIESMILVRGNADQEFVMGVRSVSDEEPCYQRAGVPELAPTGDVVGGAHRRTLPRRTIGDFYLDRDEVSLAQFLEFVEADDGYGADANWDQSPTRGAPGGGRDYWRERAKSVDLSLPVHPVTFDEALAYARWVGKELPSLAQFHYAARGGQEYRAVACGDAKNANYDPDDTDEVRPDLWPHGSERDVVQGAFEGLLNLSGNVAEWTRTSRWTERSSIDDLLGAGAPENLRELREVEIYLPCAQRFRPDATFHTSLRRSERPDAQDLVYTGFRCALPAEVVRERLADKSSRFTYTEPPSSPRER
jgi:serine/threonine protein kinase